MPVEVRFTCELCGSRVPPGRLLDHYRLLHPAQWADRTGLDGEVVTWPGGQPAVFTDDGTLIG